MTTVAVLIHLSVMVFCIGAAVHFWKAWNRLYLQSVEQLGRAWWWNANPALMADISAQQETCKRRRRTDPRTLMALALFNGVLAFIYLVGGWG